MCKSSRRLDGQVVVITGANTGIGKETAYELSLRGAKIIMGCRDERRAQVAIDDIKRRNSKADIICHKLDLSSLQSVRQFCEQVVRNETKIDVLINNAGVAFMDSQTVDGFEMAFGTNHLGHFLLTLQLLPLIKKAPKARIINLSSAIHMTGKIHFENINLRNGAYTDNKAYAQSKLANILFTKELAKRLGSDSTINVYAVHPGGIRTELARNVSGVTKFMITVLLKRFLIDVNQGSQTTLHCALDESLDNETGHYYANCLRVDDMFANATDDRSAQQLWQLSADWVKLEDRYKL
ncbi:unnamed protein product [Oppiella nova]|uniref:Uncharacterized protein n=1 Tax=Oppiella nova TaxID=334625 RepID=A0A7R9MAT9_9ACAR|nr:unnamed protein product [Oppiella nova]CAG2173790.1 unnamed protein product [Oppiella nova]